jgi:hypothetical protein
VKHLPGIRQSNLISGLIPDIKKAGLSGWISGASLVPVLVVVKNHLGKI